MSEDLLPCPCGREAHFNGPDSAGKLYIGCRYDGCYWTMSCWSKEQGRERWNDNRYTVKSFFTQETIDIFLRMSRGMHPGFDTGDALDMLGYFDTSTMELSLPA